MKLSNTFLAVMSVVSVLNSGCHTPFFKIARYSVPEITDYEFLTQMPVKKSNNPYYFKETGKQQIPAPKDWVVMNNFKKISVVQKKKLSIDRFMEKTKTVAFLVIRNDSILFENYYNGFDKDRLVQNFSITKPITTALVQIAIEDGYLNSIQQKVKEFLPQFDGEKEGEITLAQLMNMTGGYRSDYAAPFKVMRMYYAKKRENYLKIYKIKKPPGTKFSYSSYSTSLLGLCLEKATGQKASKYLEEKIWKKIHAEYPAAYVANPDSSELHFCGLVAQCRDIAKIGKLFINGGHWEGEPIISSDWIESTKVRDTLDGNWWGYNKGWWLDTYQSLTQEQLKVVPWKTGSQPENFNCRDLVASGYHGQMLYIDPHNNIIIVRQGKARKGLSWIKSVSKLGYLLGEKYYNR